MSEASQTKAILFADVCGSTHLFERFGDAKAKDVVGAALDIMSREVKAVSGRVVKTIGDEVMAVFDTADQACACALAIHPGVAEDAKMKEYNIAVKVGFHFGEVIADDGDVFGDAVNVAARMVGVSKCDQVITNTDTLMQLTGAESLRTRPLGSCKIRGKANTVDLTEVLWQNDGEIITTIATTIDETELMKSCILQLEYRGEIFRVDATTTGFNIGREPRNDMIVDDQWVSRRHASIEFHNSGFVLVDKSTNGTFVHFDGETPFLLQRDTQPLRKNGCFSLGRVMTDDADWLVHFKRVF